MKNFMFLFVFSLFAFSAVAEEKSILKNEPTPAPEYANQTVSPTVAQPTEVPAAAPAVAAQPAAGCDCANGKCKPLVYRNKRNIAPNAVPGSVEVSRCETCCNGCQKVSVETVQEVQICKPQCSCKETVRNTVVGNGKVYDYGKYEVVVRDRKDSVEVNYRKRLFAR